MDNVPGPEVVSVDPDNGAEYVPVNTTITITFSQDMSQTLTEAAFSISPSVTGTFNWNTPSRMTFIPNEDLGPESQYVITIANTAEDIDGNSLVKNISSSFTTLFDITGIWMELKSISPPTFYFNWRFDLVQSGTNISGILEKGECDLNVSGSITGTQIFQPGLRESPVHPSLPISYLCP